LSFSKSTKIIFQIDKTIWKKHFRICLISFEKIFFEKERLLIYSGLRVGTIKKRAGREARLVDFGF